MASAPLAYLSRLKHRISSQFCCSLSKQENHMNMNMNNINMEKWALFASCWKSRKRLFMLSTMFRWTEVLTKKVWEAFWTNPCLPRWFLVCVILQCFVNFLDDPYYEPLPWFMITHAWPHYTSSNVIRYVNNLLLILIHTDIQ